MKKVLVVVNIQNDFVDGSLGSKQASDIIPAAVKKIKEFNGDVFVTLDTHFDDYLETAEGKKLPVKYCIKNTHGWKLNTQIESVLSERECTYIEKHTFGSVDLPKLIASSAGEDKLFIELIGLCTDICVISNALLLKAKMPEVKINLDENLTEGVNRELKDAAIKTMKSCQINIL